MTTITVAAGQETSSGESFLSNYAPLPSSVVGRVICQNGGNFKSYGAGNNPVL
jgi:hypothetical protein